MIFTLKIVFSILTIAAGIALTLRNSFKNNADFINSIDEAVENRRKLNKDWNEFYDFYLKLGIKRTEIDVVKNAIQKYSQIAQVMILPHDDLYFDLKVDATAEHDDKIMEVISKELELPVYREGELIDKDISSVSQLFKFIKVKQKAQKAESNNLFLK